MDIAGAVAVRTRHQARPGRRAIVVTDLASLRGPVRSAVEPTLRLAAAADDGFALGGGRWRT